jgi:hypothetical protein
VANDLFWQNRTFYIGVGSLSAAYQQNVVSLYQSFTTTLAASQPSADATTTNGGGVVITGGTGACTPASYWDIGVRGDSKPGSHDTKFSVLPVYSALTNASENTGSTNMVARNPDVASQYCNGARTPPEFGGSGYQVPPGISDATVPNPIFNLSPSATVDEGNNWVNMTWGPLSMSNPVSGTLLGNYALTSTSPAIDAIPTNAATYAAAPTTDFFGNPRPDVRGSGIDIGAVEFQGPPTTPAVASVTGGPLAFGNVLDGQTSTAQTLTLHNTGGLSFTGITVVVTAPFSRSGGNCGTTLAAGLTCTINVVFSPTVAGAANGTATITGNVTVTGSPVALSGTGVAAVVSATLTPTTWSPSQTRNCPGVLCTFTDPLQAFTLTNTGNTTLTGIGQGTLTGLNASEYTVVRLLSTCGSGTNGQLVGITTLAPGATCVVSVRFTPLTAQPTGVKTATISVADAAGTQSSALTGTAK